MRRLKKTALNFVVDAISLAGFVFLAATGILVRYVLPPGSGHNTTLWGLDRHEWGAIHFWIAAGFLCVLALHLVLHWRWIVCVLRGQPREGSGLRVTLGLAGMLAVVAVAIAPFASPVAQPATTASEHSGGLSSSGDHFELVRGRTNLQEVERRTGVPISYLIEHLGMPGDVPLDVGVAKLGKQYGFEVTDVRAIVQEHKKE
jgi:hypothetical protein